MIDLHERLSEFSYGYGITRETERLLASVGMQAVPFLPSLLHEAELGFDVKFDKPNRPGAALMLQFKLGHSLTRFVRSDKADPKPHLDRPFWRFSVNTAEPDGQFETLLKAESDGAEVYYAAPRFADWPHYAQLFEREEVLDKSLLIRPSDIRTALDQKGAADGPHRIVYDCYRVHVCSKPTQIPEVDAEQEIARLASTVREMREPISNLLDRVFDGFNDRSAIRRKSENIVGQEQLGSGHGDGERATGDYVRAQRRRRFSDLLKRAEFREQAVAAAVGVELWTLGIQLVLAVEA